MSHPGPPRFTAVGEWIELAPRDPDPDATYHWRLVDQPTESLVTLDDEPVVWFSPDVTGRYVAELTAPDGTHRLTVRAFPGELAVSETTGTSGSSGASGMSGSGPNVSVASGSGSAVASATGDEGGRPRVRLDGGVEGDDVVLRATPSRHPDSSLPDETLDVEFLVDDRDTAALAVEGHEARLSLATLDEPVRVHAVAVGESYSVADAVRVHLDGTVVRLYEPPTWSLDASIYEIYIRGYTPDADHGEAFAALTDRLDELADLGADTLWLSPVLQNDDAAHGYNITDFFAIAEDLGTREEFEAFVDAAHDHGMRVLFDLVLNHSARQHPHFEDAYRTPDSEYFDWYEWQESGEPGTYFDWEKIANFDYHSLDVRRHLLDAVDQWADVVDGFRCDMAWAVPAPFWTEVHDRVKARQGSEFLLLDETVPYVADFHEGMFDMHFDTTLYFTLREVGRGHADADAVLDAVEQRARVGFPDHAAFMTYIENHDERRYIEECGRDALGAAAGAQFTVPGTPMVYGGQEIGEHERRDRVYWEHADEELRAFYRDLVATHRDTPALRPAGAFERIEYEADDARVTAFVREYDGERYVVVLNFAGEERLVSFPDETVVATDEVTGQSVATPDADVAVTGVAVVRVDD